ncbi:MAG: molecular chaperone TorD family protein [Eggerthellaceae bacterium]|nr:molecular chaperone TorD family protein [Eggerthellaceae bacterium]
MDPVQIQGAGLAFNLASKLVFEEPAAERISALTEQDVFEEVPFGEDDEAVLAGAALLRAWCTAHAADAPEDFAAAINELKGEWFNLLIGPSVPKAPSWAGYYLSLKSELLSAVTLEARRFYRAWGFMPDGINKEPDDNLGVLLGFLAELIYLELTEPERTEGISAAQEDFLRRFILPWICAWRWSVAKYAQSDFFRGVGELVFGLCRAYAKRFGIAYVEDEQNPHFICEKE